MKKILLSVLVGGFVLVGCKMPDIPLPNEVMESMGLMNAKEVNPSVVNADIKSNAYDAKKKWNGTRIAFTGTFMGSGRNVVVATMGSISGQDLMAARIQPTSGNGCIEELYLSGAYKQQLSGLKPGQKVAVSATIDSGSFDYTGQKCPLTFKDNASIKPL